MLATLCAYHLPPHHSGRYNYRLGCYASVVGHITHHVEQLGDGHLWLLRRQGLRHRLLLQALLRAARASNRPIAVPGSFAPAQPHSSPSFPMECPSLTHGRCLCVASRRRALHASGAPPWRRPASAAALVAAWASTAALPALFARCFGRIGVELERAHAHASRCSLTSRYKILNSHYLCSPSALAWQGRSSTAAKYGIEEGAVSSFCYACCCPGCSIIQTVNQARLHPSLNVLPTTSLPRSPPNHFLGPMYPSPP